MTSQVPAFTWTESTNKVKGYDGTDLLKDYTADTEHEQEFGNKVQYKKTWIMKNSFSVICHSVAYDTIQYNFFFCFAKIRIVSLDASIQEKHKLGIQITQTHSLRKCCQEKYNYS